MTGSWTPLCWNSAGLRSSKDSWGWVRFFDWVMIEQHEPTLSSPPLYDVAGGPRQSGPPNRGLSDF